jgi:phosphatidylserine decarboxylase
MWILVTVLVIGFLVVGFLWFTRKVWFYRDPDHTQTEQDLSALRSPVYGRVSYIRKIKDGIVVSEKKGEEIPISDITKDDWASGTGEGWLIGIAMTALDIHYQYASLPGKVNKIVHHNHGRNLPMFDLWEYVKITWLRKGVQLFAKKYVFENERQTMWFDAEKAKVGLVLIADKFVAKITTYVQEGETVRSGGKLSFISRGSQVDVVVCDSPDLQILCNEGDPVSGPLTVLARFP